MSDAFRTLLSAISASSGFAAKNASGTRVSAASRLNTRRVSNTARSSAGGLCVSLMS